MQDDDGLSIKKKNKVVNDSYILEFLVGPEKPPAVKACSAPNKESIAAVATIIVATNWPNITGFNLYRYNPAYEYDREFLMHVPAMQMMAQFLPELKAAAGVQLMRGVIPVLPQKAEGEDLQKLAEQAKKDGRNLL